MKRGRVILAIRIARLAKVQIALNALHAQD